MHHSRGRRSGAAHRIHRGHHLLRLRRRERRSCPLLSQIDAVDGVQHRFGRLRHGRRRRPIRRSRLLVVHIHGRYRVCRVCRGCSAAGRCFALSDVQAHLSPQSKGLLAATLGVLATLWERPS